MNKPNVNENSKLPQIIIPIFCFFLLIVSYLPMFNWLIYRWTRSESYYSHGFLIPLISVFIIWQYRNKLKKTDITNSKFGIILISIGLLIHIIAATLRVYFVSGFSFVLVLCGLILYFFGKKIMKTILFPVLFLLTMIPLPLVLISNLTVKLKLFVAQIAALLLSFIGFEAVRDGSIIRIKESMLLVEAPCSGLRSLVALLTLGLLFAYFVKIGFLKRVIIFLSSIPIALISNILRVMLLSVVNYVYGEKFALGIFHDFSGYLLYVVAIAGLYGVKNIVVRK